MSAQMQHGLRHGDYTRYGRYCTAQLRRLYKSLKFTHGRGKYPRRPITESTVTEVRLLHIIPYTAERAWSHAMEKRQVPDGPSSSQRIYLIGRMRKAVKWATLFSQLCAIKGDFKTSLEAEAYASYMKGSLLLNKTRIGIQHYNFFRVPENNSSSKYLVDPSSSKGVEKDSSSKELAAASCSKGVEKVSSSKELITSSSSKGKAVDNAGGSNDSLYGGIDFSKGIWSANVEIIETNSFHAPVPVTNDVLNADNNNQWSKKKMKVRDDQQ